MLTHVASGLEVKQMGGPRRAAIQKQSRWASVRALSDKEEQWPKHYTRGQQAQSEANRSAEAGSNKLKNSGATLSTG